ncbi:hypothetical protein CDL12_18538 [Handroanthus impetiginosus]|uniref:Cleavage/polyadenylation specificity factor A subunit N-terminal domain-containing protein n=1 Tax=Handroanthus impetiginosus TaxID=429701 RepID=A0A2G9GUB8_9LAMI|nr:hypothetical protein CDL12_18538 [Handroanthus impetiginosus]
MLKSSPEFEARQLILPKPLHAPSPLISSVLYDPLSSSLALRHSDSSFSLYPSFSPLSVSSFPPPKSLIPSPTSSSAFLHLRTTHNPATALFITSSPLLRPAPATLLSFYILRDDRFVKIRVISNHRDLEFDQTKSGVVFKVNHGVSMKLSGGINVFSLYSVSNSKIWVFALRLIGDEGGGEALKLMKCAVIDCCLPVFTVRILFGFLILGEENGVRIFPLQPLVKGNHRKEKKNSGKRYNLKGGLSNGVDVAKGSSGSKTVGADGDLNLVPAKGEKSEKHSDSVKLRSVKVRQDSRDVGAFFVAFEAKDVQSSTSMKMTGRSVKAISIQALSACHFVVLDSVGDVHLLCLSYPVQGLDNACTVKRLSQTMKVQKLAIFHDVSTVTQTIWMSDGRHSVHLMMVSDMDTSFDEIEKKDTNEKLIQTSVTQTIFTSEKIQDIVPLAANGILILGQGSMFAYAVS